MYQIGVLPSFNTHFTHKKALIVCWFFTSTGTYVRTSLGSTCKVMSTTSTTSQNCKMHGARRRAREAGGGNHGGTMEFRCDSSLQSLTTTKKCLELSHCSWTRKVSPSLTHPGFGASVVFHWMVHSSFFCLVHSCSCCIPVYYSSST